jgi:hypothetical protein
LHPFCINSMQNYCPHLFQLCQITFCSVVHFLQGICGRSFCRGIVKK